MNNEEKEPVIEALGSGRGSDIFRVSPGVTGMRHIFVNLYFVKNLAAADGSWVLIDAGLKGHAGGIRKYAHEHFGTKPSAILLTHGHFDHVGVLEELAREWDVPVYAHPLEMPYLTGRASYPPPDPTVGGAMARLSFLFPTSPVNISGHVRELPADGTIPGLPGWFWLHTPGHSPGHVSFFRESDRTIIAGDAFITTNQASAFSVLTQREEILGPPTYFTTDWGAARDSVARITALRPAFAGTGHGKPVSGAQLEKGLSLLVRNFDRIAMPDDGRYVREPAEANEQGTVHVPPPVPDMFMRTVATVGFTLAAGAALAFGLARRKKKPAEKKPNIAGNTITDSRDHTHYDYP